MRTTNHPRYKNKDVSVFRLKEISRECIIEINHAYLKWWFIYMSESKRILEVKIYYCGIITLSVNVHPMKIQKTIFRFVIKIHRHWLYLYNIESSEWFFSRILLKLWDIITYFSCLKISNSFITINFEIKKNFKLNNQIKSSWNKSPLTRLPLVVRSI